MSNYEQLTSHFAEHGYRRICIITTTFPPYPVEATRISVGGATIDLRILSEALMGKGFSVFVVALKWEGLRQSDPPNVLRVGNYFPYSTGRTMRGLRFALSELLNPLLLLRTLSALRRIRPDMIILGETLQFGLAPHLASTVLKIPLYMRYDWLCPSYPDSDPCGFLYRLHNCGNCLNAKNGLELSTFSKAVFGLFSSLLFSIKIKLWRKQACAVLAINDFYRNYYMGYGISERKILVVPPGQQLMKAPPKGKLPESDDTSFKILFVGRLSREKGILLLLDAFSIIMSRSLNIKLLIVGDGPLRQSVERFSQEHSDNVQYLGWLEGTHLSQAYENSDVVVIPSIVLEGHPIVADEAIQFDKTIVGFGLGGMSEILRNYAKAIKVDEVSAKRLAESILKLYETVADRCFKTVK